MKRYFILASFVVFAAVPVFAQTVPDAGTTLQEISPVPLAPKDARDGIKFEPQKPLSAQPGGAQVVVQSVEIKGNTLFSGDELRMAVGDVSGKSYDLAGLRGLANLVSVYYHAAGYPFARAYLPQQEMKDGILCIEVIEGRYGQIKAEGEASVASRAQDFLSLLNPGDVIESGELERSTLVLGDQPGIDAVPIIRPGQELGTGDLNVSVSRKREFKWEIGADNYGNRYSGEYRGKGNMQVDSPFMFGDQIQLKSLGTDEGMWLGSFSYSLPLGSSGLRAQAGFYQTEYTLGKQFESLDATGYAKVYTAGLSYPIVRSQKANLTLAANYQHKDLRDKKDSTNTDDAKNSDGFPISMQFDMRDSIGGGGITYGAVGWTRGDLDLDADLWSTDAATARTTGGFSKVNLDIARLQKLPADFTLFGRLSSQWASKNLDSSEGFGLGGSNGVRAYPVSEAYGDEGWLAQIELRYNLGYFTPFAFYDAGRVTVNADPWDTSRNNRSIAGSGLGLRIAYKFFNFDASLAWRTQGGKPESDTADRIPRAWISTSIKF